MSTPLVFCRRIAALVAPWLAALAFAACVTSALHHHAPDGRHEQCAVCSHGTAPAIAAVVTAVPSAPVAHAERCVAPPSAAPRNPSRSTALSRAPPQA